MKRKVLSEIMNLENIKIGKRSYTLLDKGYRFVNFRSGKLIHVNTLKPSEASEYLISEERFLVKLYQTYTDFIASRTLPTSNYFLQSFAETARRTRINIRVLRAKLKRTPYVAKQKKEKVIEAAASETVQNDLPALNPEQSQH